MNINDTIVAPATGNIISALGIIRMSGKDSLKIINKVFKHSNDELLANSIYFGTICDKKEILDEVVVSVFLQPHSFTGEDTIEITHHGSPYIAQKILQLLINNGARLADKGEYSLRAFLNGKINLSQAEAIADLIASDNYVTHEIAIKQLRGNYNQELKNLRQSFLNIASLLELEIDFSAEQEVFVDRRKLKSEVQKAQKLLQNLISSFSLGNAFKNGIPIAIVGKPNSGKSTLMNAILKEDRSIVSQIAGTTRDTIEESLNYDGITFRFIDTAGLRQTDDDIEKQGIERSFTAIQKANIILYLFDAQKDNLSSIQQDILSIKKLFDFKDKKLIPIINKNDISQLSSKDNKILKQQGFVFISAKKDEGITNLLQQISNDYNSKQINDKVFVTNIRHLEALTKALNELNEADNAIKADISSDIISENIRMATNYIGQITGEITNEDILTSIFSSFCIGK